MIDKGVTYMFLHRLYFRKDTGLFIDRVYFNDFGTNGFSSLPSVHEDFSSLKNLNQYLPNMVIVIELEEGVHEEDIVNAYSIRVDIDTLKLEFSYPDPNSPDAPQVFVGIGR